MNLLSVSISSTLARQVAARFALPYVELDALHHGPQWQPRPSFRDDIVALAAWPPDTVDREG